MREGRGPRADKKREERASEQQRLRKGGILAKSQLGSPLSNAERKAQSSLLKNTTENPGERCLRSGQAERSAARGVKQCMRLQIDPEEGEEGGLFGSPRSPLSQNGVRAFVASRTYAIKCAHANPLATVTCRVASDRSGSGAVVRMGGTSGRTHLSAARTREHILRIRTVSY